MLAEEGLFRQRPPSVTRARVPETRLFWVRQLPGHWPQTGSRYEKEGRKPVSLAWSPNQQPCRRPHNASDSYVHTSEAAPHLLPPASPLYWQPELVGFAGRRIR